MATQTNTPSRRHMLAGLAAAPVAGLPAIAGAVLAKPLSEALATAIERHKAAHAAIEADYGREDVPDDVADGEAVALWELAIAPCASDAELIVKLRYLLGYERAGALDKDFEISCDGPLPIAVDAHFNPEARS